MEESKDKLIATINKIIEEIVSLKENIASNKKDVDDIKEIINRLKKVELALNPKQKLLNEKLNYLQVTLNELRQIRFNIMLSMTDQMFDVIEKNLLDGMCLQNIQDNNNLKELIFNKEKVGCIEVLEDKMPEIKISVTVYENSDEFDVHEPCRMYSIISFINTKFNYKEI